jgi:hypothetical protein
MTANANFDLPLPQSTIHIRRKAAASQPPLPHSKNTSMQEL